MGSCCTTPEDNGYCCCMLSNQLSSQPLPNQHLPNKNILHLYTKRLQHKHNIYITKKIFKTINKYIGNDPIIISQPIITIISSINNSITLSITNSDPTHNITGYKIGYIPADDAIIDITEEELIPINSNSKQLKWKEIHIPSTQQSIQHKISDLQPLTSYILTATARNEYKKYGQVSNKLQCKTKGKTWKFDTITPGFEYCISSDKRSVKFKDIAYITAGYSHGFNDGVHVFKIKCNEIIEKETLLAMGIVAGHCNYKEEWIGNHDDIKYYYSALGGIYSGYDQMLQRFIQWGLNGVVTMILNCNEWTLSFDQGKYATMIKIENNKTYYPFVTGISNQCSYFEIIE